MLPSNNRIPKKDFAHILSKGKRYSSPSLLLYVTPFQTNDIQKSKFSFSVSKKVCPPAVGRNKYRRWGYSIILEHKSHIRNGYFYFFSFKKPKNKPSFNDLEGEIEKLLSEANMLS